MLIYRVLGYYALSGLLLFGCQNSTQEYSPDLRGYAYYPYQVDDVRTYKVREINYSKFGDHDTATYMLRETVSEQFTDNAGEINFVLKRETKSKKAEDWSTDSLWSTYANSIQAVLNKNGEPIINLVFPPANELAWDANALNNNTADTYTIEGLNDPYILGTEQYANTLIVQQDDKPDSLSSFDYRMEVYAKDIGLIYKIDSRLRFCQKPLACYGLKIVESGRYYIQELVANE
jgi:hypothetical protein